MRINLVKQAIIFSLIFFINLPLSLFAEPPNLSLIKHAVIQYHDSGCYEKELASVAQKAEQFIQTRVEQNQKLSHPAQLAIVLDIDETSLSNYSKMLRHDFTFTHAQIHQEILAANDPAIPQMLHLFHLAQKRGINIFFVTGRFSNEKSATVKNLHAAGFDHWQGLYLRPLNYHELSIIPFKSKARAAINAKGYTIIASIGDQISDLQGGYAEKTFKLPNPYYYLP